MLVELLIGLGILIVIILVSSTQFFPLMDMEARRREGLPYDDLLEKKPPGKLVWAVLIGGPLLFLIASWVL